MVNYEKKTKYFRNFTLQFFSLGKPAPYTPFISAHDCDTKNKKRLQITT